MLPAGSQYTSSVYTSWYILNQFKMYQDNNYYKQHNPPQFAEELRNESIFNQPGSSMLAPNLASVDGVQQSAGQASSAVDLRLSAAARPDKFPRGNGTRAPGTTKRLQNG